MQNSQKPDTQNNKNLRIVTWQEYSNHITGQDCWVLVDGYLYDVSDYLVEHPGGDDILLKYSGLDASQAFNDQQHSSYAISLRNARRVGKIQSDTFTEDYRVMLEEKKKKLRQARKTVTKRSVGVINNFTEEQVLRHNNENSCWIIIDNKVYDVTNYMGSHPGGQGVILDKGGKDATLAFKQANHSVDAIQKREQFLIGTISKQQSKTSNLVTYVSLLILVSIIAYFVVQNL